MKITGKPICVFDLDGTIWHENSHIVIVEQYLKRKKYSNIMAKLFGKFFFNSYMKSLNDDYQKIPHCFIESFCPHYRADAINMMEKMIADGMNVIIISNAPREIIDYAEHRLGVKSYRAEIGHKLEKLNMLNEDWDFLIVVTDNLSDADLIRASSYAVVYSGPKQKKQFQNIKTKGFVEIRNR